MKKQIISCLIVTTMFVALFQFPQVFAANNTIELPLNETVTASYQGTNSLWMSFNAQIDGYYKYEYTADSWDTSGLFYSKDGEQEFWHMALHPQDNGGYNAFNEQYQYKGEIYLHKGDYLFRLQPYSSFSGNQSMVNVSVTVEMSSPRYPADFEPNDISNEGVRLSAGGAGSGYLGGYHDDGTKDEDDFFICNVPNAGTYPFKIESECEINIGFFLAETGDANAYAYASYTDLSSSYTGDDSIEFPSGGQYILKLHLPDNRNEGAYKFTLGGTVAFPESAGEHLSTEAIDSGIRLSIPPLKTGAGWQIWRSETQDEKGELITGLVTSDAFVDVNVVAGKTYFYTVEEVMASGNISGISQAAAATATKDLVSGEIGGKKGFILMTIDDPWMSVNGELREIDPGRGTKPVIVNGRTLVPIRSIVEGIGGIVNWNDKAREVSIDCLGRHVEMTLGSRTMLVDETVREMDIPAQTINGRTVLPIRFVGEGIDCTIEWLGSTRQVVIVFAE